jgi:hypothetical protein
MEVLLYKGIFMNSVQTTIRKSLPFLGRVVGGQEQTFVFKTRVYNTLN